MAASENEAADKTGVPVNAQLIHDAASVNQAYERLAAGINRTLAGENPLVLCVLLGGLAVTGRLLSRLNLPCEIGYVHVTRYHDKTTGGALRWISDVYGHVQDRVVLIVDDILDEGTTLLEIENRLRALGAARVVKAVLVKKLRTGVVTSVDFFGLEVPDKYVFGCGMDYHGKCRNLPEIYALAEE